MSVVKYQQLDRYWSQDGLYSHNPVSKVMSRTRFQAILSFLQVTPPADIDHKGTGTNKFHNLWIFIDIYIFKYFFEQN